MAGFVLQRQPVRSASAARAVVSPVLIASAFAAALFLALSVAALDGTRMTFDPWLMERIQRIDVPGFERVLHPVDMLTSSTFAIPLWFAAFAIFVAARWWLPAATFIVMPIGTGMNQFASVVIARPKPEADEVVRVVGETDAFSFPSGHVAGAVLMYGIIFIIADRIANRLARIAVKAAAVAIILTIGPARIYYGAHWPSDVLAAYALGGAIIAATAFAYRRVDALGLEAAAVARFRTLTSRVAARPAAALTIIDPRRLLRPLTSLFSMVGAMSAKGTQAADRFVREGIDTWAADGHLTDAEAEDLREQADAPEVTSALAHLGAHIAMSIPLRFPLGSIARPAWTLSMRAKVEWNALRGRVAAKSGRQEHTLLVAAASAFPGFGAAAYMLSKPLRSRRAIAMIAFDRSMRRIPFKVYDRLHVAPLMVWHAKLNPAVHARQPFASSIATRLAGVRANAALVAAVIAINVAAIAAFLAVGSDDIGRTAVSVQLTVAALAGVTAWVAFWRRPSASQQESAGIMLWLIIASALVFAAVDPIFGLHRQLETRSADLMSLMPMAGALDDAMIFAFVITALSVLYVFKDELFAGRSSSAVLLAGTTLTGLAIGFDALGASAWLALEFPLQIVAAGLLMLASVLRMQEVRQPVDAIAPAGDRPRTSRLANCVAK